MGKWILRIFLGLATYGVSILLEVLYIVYQKNKAAKETKRLKEVSLLANHRDPALRNEAIVCAREVLNNKDNYIILDTETTGLGKDDVVIQIAAIDLTGQELLNTLIKPTQKKSISKEATAIHNINIKDLTNAPHFADVLPDLLRIAKNKTILIYNVDYDKQLMSQSCKQDGISDYSISAQEYNCLMELYAVFVGQWSDYFQNYTWQKLPNGDHSAIGDCRAALSLIEKIGKSTIID